MQQWQPLRLRRLRWHRQHTHVHTHGAARGHVPTTIAVFCLLSLLMVAWNQRGYYHKEMAVRRYQPSWSTFRPNNQASVQCPSESHDASTIDIRRSARARSPHGTTKLNLHIHHGIASCRIYKLYWDMYEQKILLCLLACFTAVLSKLHPACARFLPLPCL